MVRLFEEISGLEIHITGIVQGVGFRPHVYKLAQNLELKGWVINTTAGVTIHIEGTADVMEKFCDQLQGAPPPLASIESFAKRNVAVEGYSAFFIQESQTVPNTEISIPPDVGTCPDCLREYQDEFNRRHGYDFTNCVNCGPRFSITREAPYDRKNTSMAVFPLCQDCGKEYTDPEDRRFHAEPNACPVCGPQIYLTDHQRRTLSGKITDILKEGKILAIKGIGGYHLACNALDGKAVRQLREGKRRQAKPFAIMCKDLPTVREYCELSQDEEKLLTSPPRPILLLQTKKDTGLSQEIAPGLDTLGVMLPYTPLHYGLFADGLKMLIMTSANISGDPLVITEEEAYEELAPLVDGFVIHKREIVNRSDDSVVMLHNKATYFIRRSRGYVPTGIKLPRPVPEVLAVGGDLKSSFAFGRNNKATMSQFFGDLDNLKNFTAYEKGVEFFQEFLHIKPQLVVADLHPNYLSTEFAETLGLPIIRVQHHKAHFAGCLADNGLDEKTLGVVCDGTGYGEDGSIWGCEFFYGDYDDITRVGSLESYGQPRGDTIQKNPLHMAAVLLYTLWQDEEKVARLLPEATSLMPYVKAQVVNPKLSITSTSSGRLFDAAAAICGLLTPSTYEGEAAMVMETMAKGLTYQEKSYSLSIEKSDIYRLSWSFINDLAEDKSKNIPAQILAARFHHTFGNAIVSMLVTLAKDYPADKVVFSGGTFQNPWLINYLTEKIPTIGLQPFFHRQVPTNDGGLALGQIMFATGGEKTCV